MLGFTPVELHVRFCDKLLGNIVCVFFFRNAFIGTFVLAKDA